jgi:hypothetical protein
VGGLKAGEVLHTIVEALANFQVVGGVCGYLHTLKNFVGEVTESVLDTGGDDVVVTGSVDSVSAPDSAVGVVVDHGELFTSIGGSASYCANLYNLLHHVHLDGGERVVALGGNAVGAISAIETEVASAGLDLSSIPKLVDVAVRYVGVSLARDSVGSDEAAGTAGGCLGGELKLRSAGQVLELVAGAGAAVLVVLGEFIDEFAGTVARTALRASRTAAAFAFVAIEAFALARLAVAGALVATFSVVVSLVGTISGVGPSKGEGAGPQRTISTLPVLVARAFFVGTADAISRAAVWAHSGGESEGREGSDKLHGSFLL